jgi:hypothetical protein
MIEQVSNLIGSEKQIFWAEKIKTEKLDSIEK